MSQILKTFSFLGFCFLLGACREESLKVNRDEAIRHYLNQSQYEEAIGLLKERLADNPRDDEARILLASAYSGSVGVNSIECFDILEDKLFVSDSSLKAPMVPVETAAEDPQASDRRRALLRMEKELLKMANQASQAMDIAFRLPHLPVKSRVRIQDSLNLLKVIPEDSSHYLTAQLYIATLSVVQFMNYFRDGIPQGSDARTWYWRLYCQADLKAMLPNMTKASLFLRDAFSSMLQAERLSHTPFFDNLEELSRGLEKITQVYQENFGLFDMADDALRSSRAGVCVR